MVEIKIDEIGISFDKNQFIKDNFINNEIEICFIYKSCFFNSKILRDFIDVISTYLNISPERRIRLILIVDELNNNAIEYWSISEEENILRVKIIKNKDDLYIKFEVEDTWHWIESKKSYMMKEIEKSKKRPDNKSIRWRWLFVIIKQLVDRLYFMDSKTWWLIVWIEKKLNLGK